MKEQLSITLLQADLHWEDPEANRKMFSALIEDHKTDTDLYVLPEMFTTGFTMNAQALAEPPGGTTLQWMQQTAYQHRAAVTGSIIVKDNDHYYNRLYFVRPDTTYEVYDKKHTFTLAGEDKVYSKGKDRLVLHYLGWKICPLICYDLRFPVWSRNTEDYDLLLYVANWPDRRITAWDALLQARAIENMCYCIGLNRVGRDGNGHLYTGHSGVYDALGTPLNKETGESVFTQTHHLKKGHIEETRKQLRFLDDRDSFSLR